MRNPSQDSASRDKRDFDGDQLRAIGLEDHAIASHGQRAGGRNRRARFAGIFAETWKMTTR